MIKPNITTQLLKCKNENFGNITFNFADGTRQRQPLNTKIFYDEKGKSLDLYKVVSKINDICQDIKAINYEIS